MTKEDEILSSALGGTARLVPRKQCSSVGSRCGTSMTDPFPFSSPCDTSSSNLSRVGNSPPQHIFGSPATTLAHPLSPIESPRMEWQNVGYPYSTYSTNPTTQQLSLAMDATAVNWYNARPIQFHDSALTSVQNHQTHQHQQSQHMNMDVTMGNTFPSFGQTSSTLSGAMLPYDYSPQQVPPPQNNAHAHWQNLFAEMGANYP